MKDERHKGMTRNFDILYGKKEPVSDERKYTLTITETQAAAITAACELFARIGLGQFEYVAHIFDPARKRENWSAIEEHFFAAKVEAGFPRNGGPGIHNSQVGERFKVAYDLKQVVTHRIAWDRNPKGGIQVQFDEPHRTSEHEPLATITEIK